MKAYYLENSGRYPTSLFMIWQNVEKICPLAHRIPRELVFIVPDWALILVTSFPFWLHTLNVPSIEVDTIHPALYDSDVTAVSCPVNVCFG